MNVSTSCARSGAAIASATSRGTALDQVPTCRARRRHRLTILSGRKVADRWWDVLAEVVELACLAESRSNAEQRALLRVAAKVDRERSKQTVTNPPEFRRDPYLERLADSSRVLEEGERRVTPPSETKAKRAA